MAAKKPPPEEMTLAQLRERASKLEITGRSSMNKADLMQAIADAEEQLAPKPKAKPATRARREPRPTAAESAAVASTAGAASNGSEASAESDSETTGDGETPASEIPAPSIGPNTVIEKEPAEERLSRHDQSDVDAMGLDKRRAVVGGSYSPSFAKQATLYGSALAIIAALFIGGKLLIDELDQPPDEQETSAPWAQPGAAQTPPGDPDFPPNGDASPDATGP